MPRNSRTFNAIEIAALIKTHLRRDIGLRNRNRGKYNRSRLVGWATRSETTMSDDVTQPSGISGVAEVSRSCYTQRRDEVFRAVNKGLCDTASHQASVNTVWRHDGRFC